MKFKFRPSNKKRRLAAVGDQRKKLLIKGANTPRPSKCKSLERNHKAENFGVFEEAQERFEKSFWQRLQQKINHALQRTAKKRSKKSNRLSISTILGVLSGSLFVCLLTATVVIGSVFAGYSGKYTEVSIPNLLSLDASEAIETNTDIFDYEIIYKSNPSHPSNTVTAQTPLYGITRKFYGKDKKIKITLTVNVAEPDFIMPSLVGTQLREALIILKAQGINVNVIKEFSNTAEAGSIIYSSLPEGTKIKSGDTLTLKASLGKEKLYFKIPNLDGLTEAEAIALIESNGFTPGEISYAQSKKPTGTVISQSVAPNTSAIEKSKISFTVSGGIFYEA